MTADTDEELQDMARRMKLPRKWFQNHPRQAFQHYDLTPGKRAQAIAYGAREETHFEFRRRLAAAVRPPKEDNPNALPFA